MFNVEKLKMYSKNPKKGGNLHVYNFIHRNYSNHSFIQYRSMGLVAAFGISVFYRHRNAYPFTYKIKADSKPGTGTIFTIILPKAL